MRRELCQRIEAIMKYYQFGPSQNPVIGQINSILTSTEGAVGGHRSKSEVSEQGSEKNRSPLILNTVKNTGITPKQPMVDNGESALVTVSRTEWDDMKRALAELTAKVLEVNPSPGTANQTIVNKTNLDSCSTQKFQQLNEIGKLPQTNFVHNGFPGWTQPLNARANSEQETSSEDEEYRRPYIPTRQPYKMPRDGQHTYNINQQERPRLFERRGRYSCPVGSSELEYSTDNRYNVAFRSNARHGQNHRNAYQNRIEKWKLRFSGDQRSVSVENFLYKAKKLADREEIPREILLRDVHMLLEGPASDWFFTFVDELNTWQQFETSITYRFGNPNMDQGIRSKIHERKQLRGETFIAFVSEIEKLDRLLSRPLSKRRKFEVVWDNMRQHYRTKISLVEVKDLQHLIQLNHRIDAADPQLQQQTGEIPIRRPVHQIEAEYSDYESDQSAMINAIDSRRSRNFRQNSQHVATRDQQTAPPRQTAQEGQQLSCWNCQEQGHGWRQCQKPKVVFCYGCGFLGRTIRSCERCSRPAEGANFRQQGNE